MHPSHLQRERLIKLVQRVSLDADNWSGHDSFERDPFFFEHFIDGNYEMIEKDLPSIIEITGVIAESMDALYPVDDSYLAGPYDRDIALEGEQLMSLILYRIRSFTESMEDRLDTNSLIQGPFFVEWAKVRIAELEQNLFKAFVPAILQFCKKNELKMYHPQDEYLANMIEYNTDTHTRDYIGLTSDVVTENILRLGSILKKLNLRDIIVNDFFEPIPEATLAIGIHEPMHPYGTHLRGLYNLINDQTFLLTGEQGTYCVMSMRNYAKDKSLTVVSFRPKGSELFFNLHETSFIDNDYSRTLTLTISMLIADRLFQNVVLSKDEHLRVFGVHSTMLFAEEEMP